MTRPHRRRPPVHEQRRFRRHVVRASSVAFGIIAASLAIGVVGYKAVLLPPHDAWVDALYNAAMILGGMGPVDDVSSPAGRIFGSAYAIFSGVTLLTSVGVLLAPVLHRVLHRLHVETEDEGRSGD